MIRAESFPTFWIFMYWLNPLHYALEGLNMTQFHDDNTKITTLSGQTTTAEIFIGEFFSTWSYSHRWLDVMALILFIGSLRYVCIIVSMFANLLPPKYNYRFATYLALKYVNNKIN